MITKFSEEISKLPEKPGVYLMKSEDETIIYVGKAKNLKNRVSSYFISNSSHSIKTKTLVKNIYDFEYIITDTEVEALILENNLIKKYKPRFNIRLKDDKTYPYIKITNERFPRVLKVREILKDGAKYFGPYTSDYDVNFTIDAINDTFMLRKNNRDLTKKYNRPCLNYYIKKCYAPCMNYITIEDYNQIIENVELFLNGKSDELLNVLDKKMKNAAKKEDFEIAIIYKKQINSLNNLNIKQKISVNSSISQDIIGIAKNSEISCITIFFVREGLLLGRENFLVKIEENENIKELISEFITQFYGATAYIPKEIIIEEEIEDIEFYKNILSEKSKQNVQIIIPKKGHKYDLLKMAKNNADEFLLKHIEKELKNQEKYKSEILLIKDFIKLKELPSRIEIYDISNILGTNNVASMVVYENGKKKPSDYRRFKIKTIMGANDYGSMSEILYRRFCRFLEKDAKFEKKPNLIIIDGAKAHCDIAISVLNELKIYDIEVIGLFKDDKHKTNGVYYNGENIIIDRHNKIYSILASMQDEVHRFAISYHRSLRSENMIKSELDEIYGIGVQKKKNLLLHFKSIKNIKIATIDELMEVKGISLKNATEIYNYFNNK